MQEKQGRTSEEVRIKISHKFGQKLWKEGTRVLIKKVNQKSSMKLVNKVCWEENEDLTKNVCKKFSEGLCRNVWKTQQ